MGQYNYIPKEAILENIIIDFDLEEKNFLTWKCGKWKLEKKGKKRKRERKNKEKKEQRKEPGKKPMEQCKYSFHGFFSLLPSFNGKN